MRTFPVGTMQSVHASKVSYAFRLSKCQRALLGRLGFHCTVQKSWMASGNSYLRDIYITRLL